MSGTSIQNLLKSAEQHLKAGQLLEAERLCNEILRQQPNNPHALNLLAILARRQGHITKAVEIVARAVKAHPNVPEFRANLGEFSRVAGQLEQSIASFRRAIDLKPQEPTFHNSLAMVLFETRDFESAIAEYRRAIQLKPDYAIAYNNLAGTLRESGRLDEAADTIADVLRLFPRLARAHLNEAIILADKEQFSQAAESYRRAIDIEPDFAEAHWSLGTLLLLLGDMERGWREYQWRPGSTPRASTPLWTGQDLRGKTILLHGEQGLGDSLQFIRYVPMLAEKGANIWFLCQPELSRLLGGFVQVLQPGQPFPPHDFHCPLLNLPMILDTNLQNIPTPIPYLHAQPELSQQWSQRLGKKNARLRVGLVWAGRPEHRNDVRRSIRFDQLSPILKQPNIEFFNLQKGPAAQQAGNSSIAGLGSELQDFADTAALIEHLDLIITVDTAIAHLTGAMGRPTWVLLARVPDWRWLLDRTDSPWYPTLRLFRQRALNQWDDPIREVAQAMSAFELGKPPV